MLLVTILICLMPKKAMPLVNVESQCTQFGRLKMKEVAKMEDKVGHSENERRICSFRKIEDQLWFKGGIC